MAAQATNFSIQPKTVSMLHSYFISPHYITKNEHSKEKTREMNEWCECEI